MLISVCIATYNGEKYIEEQINSILPQLSKFDEIIISDDGSTDRTLEILASINDHRIKILKNNDEHGCASNFENALKHSKGDVIFLCDQDDIWSEKKVQTMLADLSHADMVISDASVVNGNLEIINGSFWQLSSPNRGFWGNIYRFAYLGCCMCFRRCVLMKALPFPKNHKMATHDNWLCVVGLFFFNVYYEKSPLIQYRRHTNNVSEGRLTKSTKSFFFKIKYRIYLLWHLFIRKLKS
ncbi:MAG: glycosyltransferase family 2 protein [Bacteroides sp.]|uniref:glycosyltransferase family 2 protein n=1 Tax=Bacteroides sp. TaxID=29523 RepID=UPI0026E06AA5|nr:glycosyltransferase family 2 protein [Bacteroides sp.]MDO5420526.1 glycosyltransferase family 2 protein [Bacteroides sp.]